MGVARAKAFPFDQLPRVGLAGNAIARWLAIAPKGQRVEQLVGGRADARVVDGALGDPFAACCELRVRGQTIGVRGASGFVRAFAQKLLGGPEELGAPRPLTESEQAMWTLLVAAAVEDLGIDGEVWPSRGSPSALAITLEARLAGAVCTIELGIPGSLELAAPTGPGRWANLVMLDLAIIVGRCELLRADVARLAVRSVITIASPALPGEAAPPNGGAESIASPALPGEAAPPNGGAESIDRPLAAAELVVLGGAVGLATGDDPLVARVATEYVPRAMALPDDARVELTVGLGTTRMSLRTVTGLAIGEVVPLGRPLAGPFEIRVEGTLIGQGELVDVDGELGVRIVSLVQE